MAWADKYPYIKSILPTAPERHVTINRGARMRAWYDIKSLSIDSEQNAEDIRESVEYLRGLLAEEAALGIPYARMILSGFSQGGAMSLCTGLQVRADNANSQHKCSSLHVLQMPSADMRLAGIICMSGYLACHQHFRLTDGLQDVPILHCHGDADPVVR